MTDVKRLLDGADLPWHHLGGGEQWQRRIYAPTDGVNLATTWWDGNPHPTAELIVHAVNRLPDYEAAVDALRRLLINGPNHTNYEGCADGMPWPTDDVPDDVECDACQAVLAARRALRRLRNEVPA